MEPTTSLPLWILVSFESQPLSIRSIFFLLAFLPLLCALAVCYQDGQWVGPDSLWQAAAWSIVCLHLDIFSAKEKQGLRTCSIPLGFHKSCLFSGCLTNSLEGCYCLIPVSLEALPVVLKRRAIFCSLENSPYVGACVFMFMCNLSINNEKEGHTSSL